MDQLKLEIKVVPQEQLDLVLVEVPSTLHVFSNPVVKDYTYAKSSYLIP